MRLEPIYYKRTDSDIAYIPLKGSIQYVAIFLVTNEVNTGSMKLMSQLISEGYEPFYESLKK